MSAPSRTVTEFKKIGENEWAGRLDDGRHIHACYRFASLRVGAGRTLEAAADAVNLGTNNTRVSLLDKRLPRAPRTSEVAKHLPHFNFRGGAS